MAESEQSSQPNLIHYPVDARLSQLIRPVDGSDHRVFEALFDLLGDQEEEFNARCHTALNYGANYYTNRGIDGLMRAAELIDISPALSPVSRGLMRSSLLQGAATQEVYRALGIVRPLNEAERNYVLDKVNERSSALEALYQTKLTMNELALEKKKTPTGGKISA